MLRVLVTAACITLLGACSHNYNVSTNLDRENFTEYFKPGQVQIIDREQLAALSYVELGLVEGEACQQQSHHQEPSEVDARTDARRNAANMGANAIIIQHCALMSAENDTCHQVRVCYGRAIKVNHGEDTE